MLGLVLFRLQGAQIGSGGFGVVFIGLNDQTGELLAIKNIPFDSTDKQIHQKLKELQKEIAVMKSLTHPNIVRYFQTAREGSSINIFMEYVPGGSIANLLKQFGPLKEKVFHGMQTHFPQATHTQFHKTKCNIFCFYPDGSGRSVGAI